MLYAMRGIDLAEYPVRKGKPPRIGAAFGAREIAGLIDNYTRLQNALSVAGLEGEKLAQVQTRLFELGAKYGVDVNSLADLYGKAAQAGGDLGASQQQLLALTEATSQALLITGTSTQQASGAILGLTQALASGTVRAEEFNQINEGGLRPLLQAAAATDRFGGSVSKLRLAVVDGKVSSQELYTAILANAQLLEGQASKATLTLSGAYTALTNKLTEYVGESAKSHGVTEALAEGIKLLGDNIDTVVTALAVVVAAMGTRYVAAALAAAQANVVLSAAATGAATQMQVLGIRAALTGRALLAAFGGPVGAAIFAVGAALLYVSTSADDTAQAIEDLEASNQSATDQLTDMIAKLKAAGVQTDDLGAAAERAAGQVDGLADSYRRALIEARNFNKGTAAGTIAEQSKIIADSQAAQASLRGRLQDARQTQSASVARFGYLPGQNDNVRSLEKQLEAEKRREVLARQILIGTTRANAAGVDLNDKPASASGGSTDKPKRTKAGGARTPKDNGEADRARAAQELAQLQIEELRARAQLATNAEDRADFEYQILAAERQLREDDLAARVKAKTLTEAEAEQQRAILDILYGKRLTENAEGDILVEKKKSVYSEAIERDVQADMARKKTEAMRDELAALAAEASIAPTREARVAIEARIRYNIFVRDLANIGSFVPWVQLPASWATPIDWNVYIDLQANTNLRWRQGSTSYTFANWQALGFDLNSVVLNAAQADDLFLNGVSGLASGDFRLDPACTLKFADGVTPLIGNAGIQEYYDWNARQYVVGQPKKFPTIPASWAECQAYAFDPTGWDFYA